MQPVQKKFNSLLDIVKHFPDEKSCREHLEQMRWENKIVCPHCGGDRKIYRINDGKLFKCADCLKQFTVRVGTIFEDSALPLQKWFMAVYLVMAHKKGISSVQLGKDIEVTQKTAWFVLHRIRYAVRTKSFDKPLNGIIEADETYIGGQEKNKHLDKRTKNTQGRSTKTKTAVFGIKQRDGIVKAEKVDRVDTKTLQGILKSDISPDATIMTDEWNAYNGLEKEFKSHQRINHASGEYVSGITHTNGIESFWATLKRGIYGIYHQISPKHLDKYIDEFEFRYNNRHIHDAERFSFMLSCCNGRLTYAKLIS